MSETAALTAITTTTSQHKPHPKISTINLPQPENPPQPTQTDKSNYVQASQRPLRTRRASQKAAYSLTTAWQPLSALLEDTHTSSSHTSSSASASDDSGSEANPLNDFGAASRPSGRKRRFGKFRVEEGEEESESDAFSFSDKGKGGRKEKGNGNKRVKAGGGGGGRGGRSGYGAKKLDLGDYEVIGEVHPKWRNRARPERKIGIGNGNRNRGVNMVKKEKLRGLKREQIERLMELLACKMDWGVAARCISVGVGVGVGGQDVVSVASALNENGNGNESGGGSLSVITPAELERHWRDVLSKAVIDMYGD
ncbi:MAG: hypothetical protein MMC33_003973 [Icmadophila ericetorum]|nr:hypothetical protein [Icmadophila ericetorum]